MMLNRLYRVLPVLVVALLFVAFPALSAPDSAPAEQVTCDALVQSATTAVGVACSSIGRNQACYGNRLVNVEFTPNSNLVFSRSGDLVDLLSIVSLTTTPFDQNTGDWGIAILKAQANLPDALPGQNVTFILFGDSTIEGLSSDMRAVKLQTNITGTSCEEAPTGVLIQSPGGRQVTMNINGADITMSSAVYMTAEQGVSMKMSTVEGLAIITAQNDTRLVPEGGEIGVTLGGEDGLEVAGPPSALRGFTQVALPNLPLSLLEGDITLPPSMSIGGQMPQGGATATPTIVPPSGDCTPRADWAARYTIQSGETLSGIAARAGLSLNQLAEGNCIENPAVIRAGQVLNVPFALPTPVRSTNTPIPPTVTPTSNATIIGPNLRADANPIYYGSCTVIRWDVANINQVYFENTPAVGSEARQVCPRETTTYTLSVLRLDGVTQHFQITIYVEASCGNQICEPGETYSTCPSDCGSHIS